MAENKGDIFARSYARLQALRKNIDQIKYGVSEKYVQEFHAVLSKLENVGIDISDFRIPDSWMQQSAYTKEVYVERLLMLSKLDAILGYFEIITSEKPKNIGFHTSKD